MSNHHLRISFLLLSIFLVLVLDVEGKTGQKGGGGRTETRTRRIVVIGGGARTRRIVVIGGGATKSRPTRYRCVRLNYRIYSY
jgi:hypothetical protein